MSDHQKPNSHQNNQPTSSSSLTKSSPEISNGNTKFSGQKITYPNPPDLKNPDPSTLRDQWKYAVRQYSKWYSHAWGTAILAGVSFFALGWFIKGGNPLPSFKGDNDSPSSSSSSSSNGANEEARK